MTWAISLDDVWFRYKHSDEWILKGVSMKVPERRITCILGVNGSGKSTLLKVMAGVYVPQRGTIEILGKFINRKNLKHIRSLVGLVLQDPDVQLLMPTVKEELLMPLIARGFRENDALAKVRKLAEELGIIELLDRPIDELSYGQKKRVAIASVLVAEPRILLLDEPTLGLDPVSCVSIMSILKRLVEQGKTIVFSTQDIDIAALYADYIVVLKDGQVAAEGEVDEILRRPEIVRCKCGLRLTRIGHLFELAQMKRLIQRLDKLPLTISEALRVLETLLRSKE